MVMPIVIRALAALGAVATLGVGVPHFLHAAPPLHDAGDADEDLSVQGEYVSPPDTRSRWGMQLAARGQRRFHVASYVGGLPGDGWLPGDERVTTTHDFRKGSTLFESESEGEWKVLFTANGISVVDALGNEIDRLDKVRRTSPTLDAEPPDNATVLFDGRDAAAFVGGKISDNGYLLPGCTSREKFGDHKLHLEFRTPYEPLERGQDRGNAGVYLQGRYELRVVDSFSLDTDSKACGAIVSIAKPRVNMALPPLAWQTYDIEFRAARFNEAGKKMENARVTVRHNGVLIHEDLSLPTSTPGGLSESPDHQPLRLADTGDLVEFRNIWVVSR